MGIWDKFKYKSNDWEDWKKRREPSSKSDATTDWESWKNRYYSYGAKEDAPDDDYDWRKKYSKSGSFGDFYAKYDYSKWMMPQKDEVKAGILPYAFYGEKLYVYLMIPSDEHFGGTQPQIAKGGVEEGEDIVETAIREGEEELGLKRSNFKNQPVLVWQGEIKSQQSWQKYTLHVYGVELINPDDFDKPHYETGHSGWADAETVNIRSEQKHILQAAIEKLKKQ